MVTPALENPDWYAITGDQMYLTGMAECNCGTYEHLRHDVRDAYMDAPILATLHTPDVCSHGLSEAHVDRRMTAALKGLAVPADAPVLSVEPTVLAATLRGLEPCDAVDIGLLLDAEREREAAYAIRDAEAIASTPRHTYALPPTDPRAAWTRLVWHRYIGGVEASIVEPRLTLTVARTETCWCPVWAWAGQPAVQLHTGGCDAGLGGRVTVFGTDLAAHLGVATGSTVPGPWLAAKLRGVTEEQLPAAFAAEQPALDAAEFRGATAAAWELTLAVDRVEEQQTEAEQQEPQREQEPTPQPVPPVSTASGGATADVTAKAQEALRWASEPALVDEIFCTRELKAMREYARVSMVSPLVTLMASLTAAMAAMPTWLRLPAIVGIMPSPMNFLHSAVGHSGAGKSGAMSPFFIPRGITLPDPTTPGSGAAIAAEFVTMRKEDGVLVPELHTEVARMYWPEIAKIAAVKGRQGDTTGAELCSAWSGEPLGSKTKSDPAFCPAGIYRATATIGAQLATIALLFDPDSALMGLTQRLWLCSGLLTEVPVEGTAEWEALVTGAVRRPIPPHLELPAYFFAQGTPALPEIAVDAAVWREVREDRLRSQAKIGVDPNAALETHLNLMRLRLAAAVTLMTEGEVAVPLRWWRWTGHLAEHHRRVRHAGQIAATIAGVSEAVSAGELDGVRADSRAAGQHRRALEAQLRWCNSQGEPFTLRDARQATSPGYRRENLIDLLSELAAAGELICEKINGGVWYMRAAVN